MTVAEQFLLDQDMTFLNHGSFGACPQPVFAEYQHWQRELERQPVDFLQRQLPPLLEAARDELAAFVGADRENLAFVPNATYAVNLVARSLDLRPGDEVLTTDHEYGAVNNAWQFNCDKRGARYINHPLPLPWTDPIALVDELWAGVTERTRVIAVSHITSPTALIFPVAELCRRARAAGIVTVIDGAHAPGQIDLDMAELGATFYTGNGHKWLCAPKVAAFLYADPEHHDALEPLVVSHGWSNGRSGSTLMDYFSWTGTWDPSAYLSVPAAIRFQQENDWPRVRAECHELVSRARDRIHALSGLPYNSTGSHPWFAQMATARVTDQVAPVLRERLWADYRIEVPITEWQGLSAVRLSIQAYNTEQDVDRLIGAIEELMDL